MTTTAPPRVPPAVIATLRAAAEDALAGHMVCVGDAPSDVTAAQLDGLDIEGWEITRRPPAPARPLPAGQREVLLLVACGLANRQIAKRLWLSETAVQSRLQGLFRALGVGSRLDAVLVAVELGHVSVGELLAARAEPVGVVR